MPRVDVGGCALCFVERGRGEAVVMLHGIGARGDDWRAHAEALARSYRVITLDLRGHGDSDKPRGPTSIAQMARDVVRLLDALGIDAAHVVGLSLGGMIGLELAITWPSRVRSLTVVNAMPDLRPKTLRERIGREARAAFLRAFGMRVFAWTLARKNYPRDAVRRAEQRAQLAQNDAAAYGAAMRAVVTWSVADQLEAIRCPVLVVAGALDFRPLALKDAYARRIPDAQLVVIPGSRHLTPWDQSARFIEALAAFLARVAPPADSKSTRT